MAYKGDSLIGPCPHEGVLPNGQACEGILNIPLTSFSTFVLLMSSARHGARPRRGAARRPLQGAFWLGMTAFLGSIFLGFQVYEFTHFWHEGLTLEHEPLRLAPSTCSPASTAPTCFVGVIYMITLATLAAPRDARRRRSR